MATYAEKLRKLASYPSGSFERMFLSSNGFEPNDLMLIAISLERLERIETAIFEDNVNATKGTFNKTTGIWTIGTLEESQHAKLNIKTILQDLRESAKEIGHIECINRGY